MQTACAAIKVCLGEKRFAAVWRWIYFWNASTLPTCGQKEVHESNIVWINMFLVEAVALSNLIKRHALMRLDEWGFASLTGLYKAAEPAGRMPLHTLVCIAFIWCTLWMLRGTDLKVASAVDCFQNHVIAQRNLETPCPERVLFSLLAQKQSWKSLSRSFVVSLRRLGLSIVSVNWKIVLLLKLDRWRPYFPYGTSVHIKASLRYTKSKC